MELPWILDGKQPVHSRISKMTSQVKRGRLLGLLQVMDNIPLLLYILALKTLLLCLGFAGVKIYQSKKVEAALKKQQEERRLAQQTQELMDNKKDD